MSFVTYILKQYDLRKIYNWLINYGSLNRRIRYVYFYVADIHPGYRLCRWRTFRWTARTPPGSRIDVGLAMIGILISRRSTTALWRSGNRLVADWPSKCRSWRNAQACPALWRLSVGSSRTPHWEERLEMPKRPSPRSRNARPHFCTSSTLGRISYLLINYRKTFFVIQLHYTLWKNFLITSSHIITIFLQRKYRNI